MIDPAKLPQRAAFDTGVLIGARKADEKNSPLCKALWEAMIGTGKYVLLPAPVLAEFMRHPDVPPPPRIDRVEIVSFDELAALRLAKFPAGAFQASEGHSKVAIRYDAMIIACAIRHRADALITLDAKQAKLATSVGLRAVSPADLAPDQGALFEG